LKSAAGALTRLASTAKGAGADAANRLAASLNRLAGADQAQRQAVEAAFIVPLRIALGELRGFLNAAPVTQATLPENLLRQWVSPDGRVRLQAIPKGDPNDNDTLRKFAQAIQAQFPNAVGTPVSILESGDTIVAAFLHAGIYALLSITVLLWIVLRRFGDVLLTLLPLLLAGLVALEVCVLIGMPLNFANIIALGVAGKADGSSAIEPHARRDLERARHRNRVRQFVAVEPSRHVEHGQASGAVAGVHALCGGAVPASTDGQASDREKELAFGLRTRRNQRLYRRRYFARAGPISGELQLWTI
ncbi:MAG: hypothetical protein J0H89_12320, partial [Rhizobiales bacterium]|nr:hypothetical protein [Hyphomicrobiales bacterium]